MGLVSKKFVIKGINWWFRHSSLIFQFSGRFTKIFQPYLDHHRMIHTTPRIEPKTCHVEYGPETRPQPMDHPVVVMFVNLFVVFL